MSCRFPWARAEFTRERIAAQAQRLRGMLAMAAAVFERGFQQHLVEALAQACVQLGVAARERGARGFAVRFGSPSSVGIAGQR
jgi:hypothetical protein